jgi:hypothetical protein
LQYLCKATGILYLFFNTEKKKKKTVQEHGQFKNMENGKYCTDITFKAMPDNIREIYWKDSEQRIKTAELKNCRNCRIKEQQCYQHQ